MAYSVRKLGETVQGKIPKWLPVFLSLIVTTAYQLERWHEMKIDTFTLLTNLAQMYAVATLSYLAAR